MKITTERVKIPAGAATMGGYLARPADREKRAAVLVFMEIFGINSHIRDVTERVAREGYVALAPDYFHRTGPGVEYGYDDKGMAGGMKLLGQLRADEMIADAKAAIAFLRARPDVAGDRIGAMGFCIGGHMTYLTACETDVRAAASFYGGGIAGPQGLGGGPSTVSRSAKIRGRILCLFGEKDALIPQAQVEAIRAALRAGKVAHDVVVYPGSDHGFFCDQRATYSKDSADDAWRRVKGLFEEELSA
jgi:carboxymethylenebutenolidase